MSLALERVTFVEKENDVAVLIKTKYLVNEETQQYKSIEGQRLAFIRFHQYMFALTDMQLQSLLAKHKKFVMSHHDLFQLEKYPKITLTRCAINYQLVLRKDLSCDINLLEDIANQWRSNVQLVCEQEDITSETLIQFLESIQ